LGFPGVALPIATEITAGLFLPLMKKRDQYFEIAAKYSAQAGVRSVRVLKKNESRELPYYVGVRSHVDSGEIILRH
jgi:hypothetical protein